MLCPADWMNFATTALVQPRMGHKFSIPGLGSPEPCTLCCHLSLWNLAYVRYSAPGLPVFTLACKDESNARRGKKSKQDPAQEDTVLELQQGKILNSSLNRPV